jgi:membrane protein YdbS with pleckstrin-like domain
MSTVAKNLLANETVVLESKKHWIAPLRDSWIPILMLLGGLFLWWWNPQSSGDGIIAGAVDLFSTLVAIIRWVLLVGSVLWIVYNVVAWRTAEFALTNKRVLRYEGLLQKRSSETLLSAVTDVKLNVGFLGSKLGYGDVKIYTQSGEAGADDFTSITQPGAFRTQMLGIKLEEEAAARQAPYAAAAAMAAAAPVPAAPSPVAPTAAPQATSEVIDDQADRLVKLAELRDQGVITPEEFEAKKAEILSRI